MAIVPKLSVWNQSNQQSKNIYYQCDTWIFLMKCWLKEHLPSSKLTISLSHSLILSHNYYYFHPCCWIPTTLNCYSSFPRSFPSDPLSISPTYSPYWYLHTTFYAAFPPRLDQPWWMLDKSLMSIDHDRKPSSVWWAFQAKQLDVNFYFAVRSLSNE